MLPETPCFRPRHALGRERPCAPLTTCGLRIREVQSHVAERFWAIHMSYKAPAGAAGGARCQFEWRRTRVYDHVAAAVLYELCCEDPTARVLRVSPLPSVPLCTERAGCNMPCKHTGGRSAFAGRQPLTCCQKRDCANKSSDLCKPLSCSLVRHWTPASFHRRLRGRLSASTGPARGVAQAAGEQRMRWPPHPLATLAMQKLAITHLRLSGERVMKLAEELYQEGFISYPRTETDAFDPETDLLVRARACPGESVMHVHGVPSLLA